MDGWLQKFPVGHYKALYMGCQICINLNLEICISEAILRCLTRMHSLCRVLFVDVCVVYELSSSWRKRIYLSDYTTNSLKGLKWLNKGREPNLATALASQPAAVHSLSLFYYYCFMTLGWGLLVGPAAESCGRIWLPCLIIYTHRWKSTA